MAGMLAARLHGIGDLRVDRESVPRPGPGEHLVRVTAVGICGSDLHWYADGGIGDARLTGPTVVCHEAAGVIEGGPRHGQRVAIDPAVPCGACEVCLAGDRNLCPTVAFCGHGRTAGALREYLAWPDHLLHPLAEALSDADGAMLEPLGVAVHAHDLGHQRVASTVAVVGCGPIGLCLVQLARVSGAVRVLAADPLPHRVAAALRFGADVALPVEPKAGAAAVAQATGGRGVDVVYEVCGTDRAVALALDAARPGARVVLVGIPGDDVTRFGASTARRKGLTLVLVRRMKEVYPRAQALVQRGLVDVRSLVTHRFGLADADRAFRAGQAREGLKVMIEPNADGAAR
jgi:L-iditol 2-dehydrogenase